MPPLPVLLLRERPVVGLALSIALSGCWGQPGNTQGPSCIVTGVSVAPTQLSLVLGGASGTLTATVAGAACEITPAITWSSSSSTAVTLTGGGASITVAAIAASATPITITATAGEMSGTAQVTILSTPAIGLSETTIVFATTLGGVPSAIRTVTVSNAGGGALTGLALDATTYSAGATGWLQAALSSGTAAPTATLTIEVQRGALPLGTYTATVPVTSTAATNSPRLLTVRFIVQAQLGSVPTIAFERWSGSTYPSTTGEIWRMDPDGQNQVQLTTNTTFDGYPQLSPDRTKIAFATNRAGNIDLYLMDAHGNAQVGLRTTVNPEVGSSWSPDGLRLAYEFVFSATDVDLRVFTLATQTETVLAETPQGEESPSWSADGLSVAFARNALGTGAYEIFRVALAGGAPVQLTTNTADDFSPAWSPDGTRIAFSSNRSGTYNLYVMDAGTGANVTQLTTVGTNYGASWSPDGTRIAYTSGQGNDWDIWVMNADGSGKLNLTATPTTKEIGPSWR